MLYLGEGIAISAGDREISYKEFYQKVNLFSTRFLNSTGHAVIFCDNREGWAYAFYSVWNKGMIPVPVDYLSKKDDLVYIFNDCKPSLVFCSVEKKQLIEESMWEASVNAQIILIDELERQASESFPATISLNPSPDDIAIVIYTSGTTGKPKGVMITFRNIEVNIIAVSAQIPIYTKTDTTLMLLPLHHILPLLGTLVIPITTGGKIAICPSMASEEILKTLNKEKVSIIIGVPRLYTAIRGGLMDKIRKSFAAKALFNIALKVNSLSFSRFVFASVQKKFGGNIRYLVSGGAALDVDVARDLRNVGFEILEGYGMTEAAPMITFTRPGKVKIGSAGEALYCSNIQIRDGEIVVSGENIMKGYYNKPEETAEVIKDNWLYTGDLGYLDNKGLLYITGRKKEIIVLSNGKNINPVDIEEQIIKTHPVVKEVGVFQDGDRLRAIIVPDLKIYNEQDIAKQRDFIRQHVLQPYNQSVVPYKMVLSFSVYFDELPKTRIGKIQRFKLKDLAVDPVVKQESEADVKLEEYQLIKSYLENEKKIKIQPSHHLEMDLGLDSLDKVSLQVFIESSFGIQMELSEIVRFESILSLSEYIHSHKQKSKAEKINWSEILKQKIHLKLPSTWITGNLFFKLSRLFFAVYFRFRGKGEKNIPSSPCIIVANHQSFFDGLFVASMLRFKQMRRTYFYAKEKHVRNPFVKFLANRNNIIIMDLNHNLKESIQKMAEVLRKKRNLIIFPEGTRTKDGKMGDFKKTFAILSRELNVPVVPVTISGAYKALPKGSFFPKPFKKIKVEFHKPVFPENHSYETLSDAVRNKIERNLDVA
jgi:long-chain acyl-CoA synthetase